MIVAARDPETAMGALVNAFDESLRPGGRIDLPLCKSLKLLWLASKKIQKNPTAPKSIQTASKFFQTNSKGRQTNPTAAAPEAAPLCRMPDMIRNSKSLN